MPSSFFLSSTKSGKTTKDSGQKRKYEGSQKGKTKMKKKFTIHSKTKGSDSKGSKRKFNILFGL